MKIPVYTAISIEAEMPSGSTHPIILEVMDDEAFVEDRYVVKISSLQRIEREHPANKEFYAYALANNTSVSFLYFDKNIKNNIF